MGERHALWSRVDWRGLLGDEECLRLIEWAHGEGRIEMAFASKAQQGYMHAHPEVLGKTALHEWDQATKKKKGGFKKLPEHVHPANGQHEHQQHLDTTANYNGHGQQAGAHPTGSPCPAGDCPDDGGM
jgi:hypothetical protein